MSIFRSTCKIATLAVFPIWTTAAEYPSQIVCEMTHLIHTNIDTESRKVDKDVAYPQSGISISLDLAEVSDDTSLYFVTIGKKDKPDYPAAVSATNNEFRIRSLCPGLETICPTPGQIINRETKKLYRFDMPLRFAKEGTIIGSSISEYKCSW